MFRNMLDEIYLESGLLYVENETMFNHFKKLLKRSWVFVQVMFLIPVVWAYKKVEQHYND